MLFDSSQTVGVGCTVEDGDENENSSEEELNNDNEVSNGDDREEMKIPTLIKMNSIAHYWIKVQEYEIMAQAT